MSICSRDVSSIQVITVPLHNHLLLIFAKHQPECSPSQIAKGFRMGHSSDNTQDGEDLGLTTTYPCFSPVCSPSNRPCPNGISNNTNWIPPQ